RALHRWADVVLLIAEPRAPAALLGHEANRGLHRQGKHPLHMPTDDRVALASLVQSFGRVLTDRLEHVQTRLGAVMLDRDERLAGQALDRVGHPGAINGVSSGDLLGRVEGEATREDGEPPEDDLLVGGKQLMAPVEGGPHRLLAFGAAATPVAEKFQLPAEAGGYL